MKTLLLLACAAWGLSFSPTPNAAQPNDCAMVRQTLREFGQLVAMQAGAALTAGLLAEKVEPKTIVAANRRFEKNERLRARVLGRYQTLIAERRDAILLLTGCGNE